MTQNIQKQNINIYSIYFSPCGNTKKVVDTISISLKSNIHNYDISYNTIDITLPNARTNTYNFNANDIVIIGFPTYAGKLPNKMLSFIQNNIAALNAKAICITTFGGRNFDNSLAELAYTLNNTGFDIIGATSISSEHVFTNILNSGRPNNTDILKIQSFATKIAEQIDTCSTTSVLNKIPGDANAPYYTPLGIDGKPVNILKVKPTTDTSKCINCKLCAKSCPLASISMDDPSRVEGICIKCHSCIHKCPTSAKYFDDTSFLSHKSMLENTFTHNELPSIFII